MPNLRKSVKVPNCLIKNALEVDSLPQIRNALKRAWLTSQNGEYFAAGSALSSLNFSRAVLHFAFQSSERKL